MSVKNNGGSNRLPVAIHKLEGSWEKAQKDPKNKNLGPMTSPVDDIGGVPVCEAELPPVARELFDHIVESYKHIPGLLATVDKYQLEMCARWFAKARELAIEMNNPRYDFEEMEKLEKRAAQAWSVFNKVAQQMGLSPQARINLRNNLARYESGEMEAPENSLAEFGIVAG